jgi:hypothetical protein
MAEDALLDIVNDLSSGAHREGWARDGRQQDSRHTAKCVRLFCEFRGKSESGRCHDTGRGTSRAATPLGMGSIARIHEGSVGAGLRPALGPPPQLPNTLAPIPFDPPRAGLRPAPTTGVLRWAWGSSIGVAIDRAPLVSDPSMRSTNREPPDRRPEGDSPAGHGVHRSILSSWRMEARRHPPPGSPCAGGGGPPPPPPPGRCRSGGGARRPGRRSAGPWPARPGSGRRAGPARRPRP